MNELKQDEIKNMPKKNLAPLTAMPKGFTCALQVIFFSCVSMAQTAIAGAEAYQCEILDEIGLDDGGRFKHKHDYGYWVGQTFVVDTGTGRTNGALRNYSENQQPYIVRSGSAEDALKILTIFGNGTFVEYLHISEYLNTVRKPFLFVSGTNVLSGHCRAF